MRPAAAAAALRWRLQAPLLQQLAAGAAGNVAASQPVSNQQAAAAAAAAAATTRTAWQRHKSSLAGVIAPEAGKTKLQGYLPNAFVVNSVQAEGAVLCLPDTWLLWDVQAMADITPASLAILDLTDPPPEVLVVGCGAAIQQLPQALQQHLRARGIAYEVLDTRNAISYFNFLNDEGRSVVGALLPCGVAS